MRKVIVIGSSGAGKSTFSRSLRDITGLPLHYLDMLWHRPDRTTISREEFDMRLEKLLRQDSWIIDGNYQRTLEVRLQACDTVFLLDYPLQVCLAGAEKRVGQTREDIPWVETELDPEFKKWIIDFQNDHLPQIYKLLEQYKEVKKIIVFKSQKDANNYLDGLC